MGPFKQLMIAYGSLALITAPAVAGQQAGHPMSSMTMDTTQSISPEMLDVCVQSQQRAAQTADVANTRLDAARQTNSPADMRAALSDLQAALSEIKVRLNECSQLAARATAGGAHAGHTMGNMPAAIPTGTSVPASPNPIGAVERSDMSPTVAPPAPQTSSAGSKPAPSTRSGGAHQLQPATTASAPPMTPADADCAMKVDPRTAPKASYKGQTYYFCSEANRQQFLKNPEGYLRKRPRSPEMP